MNWIRYPFHVKHDGRDYAPGVPIMVENAEEYLARGAELVPEDEIPKDKPARRRTAKAKAET